MAEDERERRVRRLQRKAAEEVIGCPSHQG
jgi:hypothetical protein